MSPHLRHSLLRSGALLIGCGLIGVLIGYPALALLLGALLCLGWQWLHLYWLDRWLQSRLKTEPPQALDAFWRNAYRVFLNQQRRGRKRKRKLSRTLRNFQTGAGAIPDAIVLLGRNDRVLWFNPAAQRLLGLDPRRDQGLAITSLVRHPAFVAYMTRRSQQDSVLLVSPVEPEIELRARLLPYTKRQRLLWVSDVSQTQRLERMRRDFVANASHELRTPLTVISGYLEALLDGIDDDSAWRPPLRSMQQQSERMMTIIRDLLLLSRLEDPDEALRPEPVNVPSLLTRIVRDARVLSGERGHRIELQAEPALWLNGMGGELHSAFANLVFNGVQHTPPGSLVTVSWFRDAGAIHLVVEDNGDGIPAHHLPRLSERFYRVDKSRQRERGGTGLGLAIVKHVVHRHGGRLRIASEVGKGSRFECEFPLAGRAAPPPPQLIETGAGN